MAPRLALVTGANQGIGLAIARGLATAPGMHCILTARDEARGRQAVAALRRELPDARLSFHQLDVTDEGSIARLAAHIAAEHGGRLHVLVNNAGIAFKGDTFGPEEARATLAVNLHGTVHVTEALLPFLRAAAAAAGGGGGGGGARIVNICSVAGRLAQVAPGLQVRFQDPDASPATLRALTDEFVAAISDGSYAAAGWPRSMYGVSKLAQIAYTYSLARRLLHDGIVVGAVCPGYCATAMSSFKGHKTPAEGADTALFLALEDNLAPAAVTGGLWQERRLIPW